MSGCEMGKRLAACAAIAIVLGGALPAAAQQSGVSGAQTRSGGTRTLDQRWHERRILTNPDEGRYVPNLSNPTFNETPHITTEVRPYYLYNNVPSDFLTNGGHINVLGVQARLALTDRIGVFINKSGYAWAQFDEVLPDADGALNIAFGAKYAIISSPQRSTFLTAGLKYEVASGDIESGQIEMQGGGDGFFDPFLTFGAQVGQRTGLQSSAGFNCAVDEDHDSTAFHYALHFDYEFFENLFGIIETSVLTTITEGDRTPSDILGSFEGYDLYNFGNDDSGTVATASVGVRYRMNRHLLMGFGFEHPLPGRQDLVGFRFLFDVVAHL